MFLTGDGLCGAPSSSMLDLSGTPKFYRGSAVYSGRGGADGAHGSAAGKRLFETPATGLDDFTNSEMVSVFDAPTGRLPVGVRERSQ